MSGARSLKQPGVSMAGFGKPGFCVVCSCEWLKDIEKRYKPKEAGGQGMSAAALNRWLFETHGIRFDRNTLYKHRDEHMSSPERRLVAVVEKRRAAGGLIPTTDESFLDAIRDLAHANMQANPDAVSIKDGISAVQVKAQRKQTGQGGLQAIVMLLMPKPQDNIDYIDGEARELLT